MTRIGGGFGKLYVHFGLAAWISKKWRPIKLLYKREDDITQGFFAPYKPIYKAMDEKNS